MQSLTTTPNTEIEFSSLAEVETGVQDVRARPTLGGRRRCRTGTGDAAGGCNLRCSSFGPCSLRGHPTGRSDSGHDQPQTMDRPAGRPVWARMIIYRAVAS